MHLPPRILIAVSVGYLLLSLPLLAQTQTQNGDPPDRTARLSYMEGAVSFEPAGEDNWSQAALNYPLTTGDRLWTDKDARAELETGNVAIRMSAETDLTTTSLADQLIQLGLAQGTLRVRSFDMQAGHEVEVDTANAALTIIRPGDYRVDAFPDQNVTLVTVNQGELQITGNGVNQTLSSGQAVKLTGTNPVAVKAVAVPGPDSFDQWGSSRDQKYLNAKSRQYVSPYVPGYYDLDPYGNWEVAAEYGPIWYPAGLPGGWCPYRYGRWVWVEPWGWTWLGQEAWGFAPYHYGRWVQVGVRWGWLPGPMVVAPVYAPAFVAFVGGASFSIGFGAGRVAAWFPLGPGEPFFPWYHHSDIYLRQINVTNVRNINITNINVANINNVHYRYQTVAATAVPANAFRNSEPVARNLVKVDPQQLSRAQIIPHPEINPTPRAVLAGTAPTHPPVPVNRPAIVQHAPVAPGRAPVSENTARTPPPAERPSSEPAERAGTVPLPRTPPPSTAINEPNRGAPPTTRPPLVARTPPPPAKIPYTQKEPAMQEHPGRPLEPQQKQNIREGQPAGPMRDQEFPPHAAPAPHPAPAPHGGKPKG
jgi:uncharacterized protein DUF6600